MLSSDNKDCNTYWRSSSVGRILQTSPKGSITCQHLHLLTIHTLIVLWLNEYWFTSMCRYLFVWNRILPRPENSLFESPWLITSTHPSSVYKWRNSGRLLCLRSRRKIVSYHLDNILLCLCVDWYGMQLIAKYACMCYHNLSRLSMRVDFT